MKPQSNHKAIIYVLLAIIIVVAFGTCIYLILSGNTGPQQSQSAGTAYVMPLQVTLTPEEATEKTAIIAEQKGQRQTMTMQEATAKTSLLAALLARKQTKAD